MILHRLPYLKAFDHPLYTVRVESAFVDFFFLFFFPNCGEKLPRKALIQDVDLKDPVQRGFCTCFLYDGFSEFPFYCGAPFENIMGDNLAYRFDTFKVRLKREISKMLPL